MSEFEFPEIMPRETRAAFAGRLKKAMNQWNDSLRLKTGDPIGYGSRVVRFNPSFHIYRLRPTVLWLPTQAEITALEEREANEHQAQLDRHASEALRQHPLVRLAEGVRWLIEEDTLKAAHRLSTEEWQAIHDKLAKADGLK